jgi:hypothetical protein
VVVFYQQALEQPVLGIETPARRWRELSSYSAVAQARISPNWRYNLSTPSAEFAGNMLKSAAIMAML